MKQENNMRHESSLRVFLKGLINENPVFVLILGICPALATTSSAINGLSMGLATTFVLFGSNLIISLFKNIIPDSIRIPAYMVIIATFVSVVEMYMQAFFPAIYESLGIFIPLIVVNCLILGRAKAFASKNNVFKSALDGRGMGLGFTVALTMLGTIRELLGTGKAFGFTFYPEKYGMILFVLAPGAFIALGFLIAIMNKLKRV